MHGELWKRIAFTLAALLVMRFGVIIPLPGINPDVWAEVFGRHANGPLGVANLLSGGGLLRLSILALSITPYVTAAVLLQLFTMVSRGLRSLSDAGKSGRTGELYVRWGAVLLAVLQAYGIALALERIDGAVTYPPFLFRLSTVLTLTGGTLFLMWLAERIAARGIGNGIGLLLVTGILVEGPRNLAGVLVASRDRLLSQEQLVAMVMIAIVVTVVAVAVEGARRLVRVRFAARQVGDRHIEEQSVALAFKLNPGGIMPALVASWVFGITLLAGQLVSLALDLRGPGQGPALFALGPRSYIAVSAAVIILFSFVYTAFLHDPERLARQLAAHGGAVAEVPPGTPAADYLDDTLSRVTTLGAVYLATIMLLPIALAGWLELPFVAGGTSLLIVVCVTLDLKAQVRALRSQSR